MRRKLNALCKDGSELDNISYYALLKLLIRFKRRNGNRHTDRKHSNLVNICLLFHEAMYHDDMEYRNEIMNIIKINLHLNKAPISVLEYNL